jgi:predicted AAA+ superfamily ATPase
MDFPTIIKEQREELENIEKKEYIVNREVQERAKQFLRYPNILAILGARRCGKSTLSYLLVKGSTFGYVNFDDERFAEIKAAELNKILEAFYELSGEIEYIVLDEIQNVEKWELFVNRLRRTKKVIITGSNSKFLSGELASHITGRYIGITLFPFSFREFLDLKRFKRSNVYTTKEKAEILSFLRDYLEIGGFPEVYKFGKAILSRIYDDVVTKDVLLRYGIKKIVELRKLSKYLLTNFCEETSYSRLLQFVDAKHVSTISNWISYLENSFLIFRLERFAFKLKRQFIAPKKIYCIDTGIVNAIGFKFSENIGKFMENCVAIELQRKKFMNNGLEVYYWKDYQQNEVDFVIKKGKDIKQLVQVTYVNDKNEIKEREIKALFKAGRELKCNNLLVITWDYESKENNIIFLPLWKWLLNPQESVS